jgi:GrpB-like predicted nucleotidyltransferase (UPF0157 family)
MRGSDDKLYEERLAHVTVGEPQQLPGRIELADYDPAWVHAYERNAARIRGALGARVVCLEHVGSTSVPGLAAKPVIDIVLEVADSAEEATYRPQLEAAGYELRIREPDWFEHRMFRGGEPPANLHVFSAGCQETERMIVFRDWLRAHDADRDLYAGVKRQLAAREWSYMQQYADAKNDVVAAIMRRAMA